MLIMFNNFSSIPTTVKKKKKVKIKTLWQVGS